MYYLRARFYNPVIDRFIQEDTYYGDGLNLYSYCQNNPVGYVDPSGHKKTCPIVEDITNQLKNAGISPEEIDKLTANLKGRWAKTKRALLEQLKGTGGDMKKMQEVLELFYNKKPSRDSQILSRNLIKYCKEHNIPIPEFPKAAHHIVAIHAEAAEATRTLLAEYDIGEKELNSAANGVFLPTDPTNKPKNTTLHVGSHKGDYHEKVYYYIEGGINQIKMTGKEVTKQDIYKLIDDLRTQLLNGELSLN